MKGATYFRETLCDMIEISIHAPVKGATQGWIIQNAGKPNFNPRPREGSDTKMEAYGREYAISIHAPVKGATVVLPLVDRSGVQFQSTPP